AAGNVDPGIAVGGMQPSTAEIDRRVPAPDSPGAAAEPVARLQQQAFHSGVVQAAYSRDAGSAAADDRGFVLVVGHGAGVRCRFAGGKSGDGARTRRLSRIRTLVVVFDGLDLHALRMVA